MIPTNIGTANNIGIDTVSLQGMKAPVVWRCRGHTESNIITEKQNNKESSGVKDGVHGCPQTTPVSVQNLTEEDLGHQGISQQYSGQNQTGHLMSRSEESEPQEEDGGVNQERFLPSDGVAEEAGKAGGHEMAQNPTAG